MRIQLDSRALPAGLVALAALLGGCTSDDNAAQRPGTGVPGGTSSSSGGGGGPDEDARCVPRDSAEPVDETCGLWLSANGNDAAPGTRSAPLQTLTEALKRLEGKGKGRIYACAETFDEAIHLRGGVTVYGGLDCADGWRWKGDQMLTTLTAPEGQIPVFVRGGDWAARLEDFRVASRSIDPNDVTKRGLSSTALVAQGVALDLSRCVIEAGDGAPGLDGEAAPSTPALSGSPGTVGNTACSAYVVMGAPDQHNDCGTPDDPTDDSEGGNGGRGTLVFGDGGDFGKPLPPVNRGEGEHYTGPDLEPCTGGQPGVDGATGAHGKGATGPGKLSPGGWIGLPGGDAVRGVPGQGGGGGGGCKGGFGSSVLCPLEASAGGASGGSGGSGGCGGKGGRGGGPGGASIALMSLSATLKFDSVLLKTGNGGKGGDGGLGQPGGDGAAGGPGGSKGTAFALHVACPGGPGGKGGTGGRGGGGLGGHAIGLAHRGLPPKLKGLTFDVGNAGPGGQSGDAAHQGADGIRADSQDFVE